MTPLAGLPILTVAEMRAAEARAIVNGTSVTTLMAAAGQGIAEWADRLGGGAPILLLCGPGNNGGDGYVAARRLREAGTAVRIAALSEPKTPAAIMAAREWGSPVSSIADAEPAPILIDALLGTGATRPLSDDVADAIARLAEAARLRIAVDLPSGLDADSGRPNGPVTRADITLALGALKPAHLLQPGASFCGHVRSVGLGLEIAATAHVMDRPDLPSPGPDAHKYSRGMVAVVAGAMPGASRLAAEAALRAGAGYVVMLGCDGAGPAAIVHRSVEAGLTDKRIGALLIGSGLGRDGVARALLAQVLASGHSLILDGDALQLLTPATLPAGAILTPHAGEFDALFGQGDGSKLDRTRAAATASGTIVVHKGPDTVIAAPDGRAVIAPTGSAWLSTAGTGDVLAGAVAAFRAAGMAPFDAAQAGVWLHARAAADLGAAFIADDLAHALSGAR